MLAKSTKFSKESTEIPARSEVEEIGRLFTAADPRIEKGGNRGGKRGTSRHRKRHWHK